jgi:dTMP kinase
MGMKGLFITFEGIEGSGKSTQIKLLTGELNRRGVPWLLTREPGGPPISEAVRKILLKPEFCEMLPETELLLYMASRAQHTGEWILPALKEGRMVLCDRYYDSTVAYQGAARDLDQAWISQLTLFSTYNTVPDLTFLLDLPVSEGFKRIGERSLDRLEREDVSFHERVRAQYLEIARQEPERYIVLDGTAPVEDLRRVILTRVLDRIGVNDRD